MNISPELQEKLDILEQRLIAMVKRGDKSAMSAARILREIKCRNHALLSEDGIKRIHALVDIMLKQSAA